MRSRLVGPLEMEPTQSLDLGTCGSIMGNGLHLEKCSIRLRKLTARHGGMRKGQGVMGAH